MKPKSGPTFLRLYDCGGGNYRSFRVDTVTALKTALKAAAHDYRCEIIALKIEGFPDFQILKPSISAFIAAEEDAKDALLASWAQCSECQSADEHKYRHAR